MNANIFMPNVAPMFTSVILFVNTSCMITATLLEIFCMTYSRIYLDIPNMTVAMIEAAITQMPLIAVKIMTRKAVQRLNTERRTMKIITNERQAPVRKRANM